MAKLIQFLLQTQFTIKLRDLHFNSFYLKISLTNCANGVLLGIMPSSFVCIY